MVNLKTFLGLAMPNQYCPRCHKVNIKLVLGWYIFWGKKSLTFMIPICSTIVLYDREGGYQKLYCPVKMHSVVMLHHAPVLQIRCKFMYMEAFLSKGNNFVCIYCIVNKHMWCTRQNRMKFPFSMPQEWYLPQISLLSPCYSQLIPWAFSRPAIISIRDQICEKIPFHTQNFTYGFS